jgi:hypothetical protein
MLDFGHLPRSQIIPRFDVFYAAQSAGTTTDSWQTWSKPRGVSFVYGLILAAGGAGGSPAVGSVSGGGSGAPGATNTFMVPAYYLPDALYVRVGMGGAASLSNNTDGAAGATSYLCTQPNINNESLLVTAAGGSGGTGAGVAGTGGVVAVFSNQLTLAVTSSVAGATGSNGGTAGNNGNAATWGVASRSITCPGGSGCGGTGSNRSGGNITVTGNAGVAPFPTIGGVVAAAGVAGHGLNRMLNQFGPRALYGMGFAFTGGSGGGSSGTGVNGLNGGPGAYGCGGGAGGAGGTTSGFGGNGGDGLIILLAW